MLALIKYNKEKWEKFMLSAIRNTSKGIFSYVLIGLICLTFALFGIQDYLGNHEYATVAVVEGQEINENELEARIRSSEATIRNQFGSNIPSNFTQSNDFRRNVLQSRIDQIVFNNMVVDNKYTVTDEELKNEIRNDPNFQDESGNFDIAVYERTIASYGYNKKTFEEVQRRSVALTQMQEVNNLMRGYTPKVIEDKVTKLLNQERDVDYVVLKDEQFNDIAATDEEIQQYYDEKKELHKAAARGQFSYVELSLDNFKSDVNPSEEEISAYYEANKSAYVKDAERTARHILISASESDEEAQKTALDQITAIRERIINGEDFAEVAKVESDDKGSATRGGDLGVVNRGVMVKPFEDEVFALEQNVVSEPVQTQFGFHIIEVTNITEERGKSLDEVKDEIADKIKEDEALIRFIEESDKFKEVAFESVDDIDLLAEETGLKVQTTGWLQQGSSQGILSSPEVRAIAFSLDFLDSEENSDVIEIGNRLIVIRNTEYEEPKVQELDAIKPVIISTIESTKKNEALNTRADEVVAKLEQGEDFKAVMSEYGLDVLKAPKTKNLATTAEEQSLAEVSFSQKVTEDKVAVGRVNNGNDIVVYKVNSVTVPSDLSEIEEANIKAAQNSIQAYQNRFARSEMIETLREQSDILIIDKYVDIY